VLATVWDVACPIVAVSVLNEGVLEPDDVLPALVDCDVTMLVLDCEAIVVDACCPLIVPVLADDVLELVAWDVTCPSVAVSVLDEGILELVEPDDVPVTTVDCDVTILVLVSKVPVVEVLIVDCDVICSVVGAPVTIDEMLELAEIEVTLLGPLDCDCDCDGIKLVLV